MSRIVEYLKGEYAIISAYLYSRDEKENFSEQHKLKNEVRKSGYGFLELESYRDEKGIISKERSLFIPKITRKQAVKLGVKYEQYAIVLGSNGQYSLHCTNEECKKEHSSCEECAYETLNDVSISEQGFNEAISKLREGTRNSKKNWQLKSSYIVGHVPLPVGAAAEYKIQIYP